MAWRIHIRRARCRRPPLLHRAGMAAARIGGELVGHAMILAAGLQLMGVVGGH